MLSNPTHARRVLRHLSAADAAPVEIDAGLPAPDPFGVAHACRNPSGHQPIASCGEVVCRHCGVIFWR